MQEGECETTIVTGNTSDISHFVDFSIWDWCWALSPKGTSQDKKQLTRRLGPSMTIGGALCYAVATAKGTVLHRTSVIPMTIEENNSEDLKGTKQDFMNDLKGRLRAKAEGISMTDKERLRIKAKYKIRLLSIVENGDIPAFEPYKDVLPDTEREEFEEPPDMEQDPVEFDRYVSAKVSYVTKAGEKFGIVKSRKRNKDGGLVGHYHQNPHLDTSVYEVEFEDGNAESYYANQVIESLLANIDNEGNTMYQARDFIDHRHDGRVLKGDGGWYAAPNGHKRPRRTTKGWELLAEMKGGEQEWLTLLVAKKAFPIEVAKYAVANKLVEEPAFRWWVPYLLRKRNRILKALKRRSVKRRKRRISTKRR